MCNNFKSAILSLKLRIHEYFLWIGFTVPQSTFDKSTLVQEMAVVVS